MGNMQGFVIGHYHVREAEIVTDCPSYYAADYERLRLEPGAYPLTLTFVCGYLIPMPYWLTAGIDSERIEGALYSGCCGVNYSRTELPKGERKKHCVQFYTYQLAELVKSGKVTLLEGIDESIVDWNRNGIKTWKQVAERKEAEAARAE